MIEKIKDYMKSEGFILKELQPDMYSFKYEGINMLIFTKELPYITMAVPCLAEKDDIGELPFYKIISRINETVRFVKSYPFLDSVTLFYEEKIDDDEEIGKKLDEMTNALELVTMSARKIIMEETKE